MIIVDDKRRKQVKEAGARYRRKKIVEDPDFYKKQYYRYRDNIAAYSRKNKDKIKAEILTHYGNGKLACVRCGEERFPALSIDHINGGGTAERKRLGKAGLGFYYWLRNQGYPRGYQTLCMNCQFVKKEQVFLAKLSRRRKIKS